MDFTAIADLIARVDWNLAVGISLVPIFLGLGVYYLIQGPWPWDPKYKSATLGAVFIFVAASLGAGLSGLAESFWSIAWLLGFIGFFWGARNLGRWWLQSVPVQGQTYFFDGVGEVTVEAVRDPENPLSLVTLGMPDGSTSVVSNLVFAQKASPVGPTRSPAPPPLPEEGALEDDDLSERLDRKLKAAQASTWRKQGF